MEKTKFTAGPWTLGDENNSSCDVNCGETIISLSRYPLHGEGLVISRDEMLANARVVIAAPELYEALKELVEYYNREQGFNSIRPREIDKAKSALLKAGGE